MYSKRLRRVRLTQEPNPEGDAMGNYYSIYGALEVDTEQMLQIRALLTENRDANPYISSWSFHSNGGWFGYVFFGHSVRTTNMDPVRNQVARIAATVKSMDDEFVDFVGGFFRVLADDPDRESFSWELVDGNFIERRIGPDNALS